MGPSSSDDLAGAEGADAETPRWVGPITLQSTFPFVAYAVGGLDGLPTLCFTSHLHNYYALLERMEELVRASYACDEGVRQLAQASH